jgi:hypothetical protein
MSDQKLTPVRSSSEIPEFANDTELAEFWETHEATAELIEEGRRERVERGLGPRGRLGLTASLHNAYGCLNDLLGAEGIDPRNVKLVRHTSARRGPTLYEVWRSGPSGLELIEGYQAVQSLKRFQIGDLLASFVVTPSRDTLFIGLYHVTGIESETRELTEPIYKHQFTGWKYEIERDSRLGRFVKQLAIDWGPGYKAWVQHADRQNKRIVSISS